MIKTLMKRWTESFYFPKKEALICGVLCFLLLASLEEVRAQSSPSYDKGPNGDVAANVTSNLKKKANPSFVKWSGEYRLRGLHQENIFPGSSDYNDRYSHRLILSGRLSPNDDIQAYFSANLNGNLGGNKRGRLGLVEEKLSDDQNIDLLTAYGDWDLWRGFYLRFGRQRLKWGNEALISPNNDDDQPYSFDGAVMHYDSESLHLQVGALRIEDWSSENGDRLNPNENSYFVSLELKGFLAILNSVQAFYYKVQKDNYNNPEVGLNIAGGSFNRFGVSLAGETKRFYHNLDYINLSGSYANGMGVSAWMGHGVLGTVLSQKNKLKLFFEGHFDTGDNASTTEVNEGYIPLYYNHHRYAGLMDLLAWGGLSYFSIGLEMNTSLKDKFKLQAISFKRSSQGSGPSSISFLGFNNQFINEAANANSNSVGSRDLGLEFDFVYLKNYDSGMYLEFILGAFVPDDYMKAYDQDKTVYSLRVSTGFEF